MKIFLTVLTLCSGAYGASVVNSHPTALSGLCYADTTSKSERRATNSASGLFPVVCLFH